MEKKIPIAIVLAVVIVAAILVGANYSLIVPSQPATVLTYSSQVEKSSFVTEYQTQSPSTGPNAIVVDSAGNVWFVAQNRSALAELFPENGTLKEFEIPSLQGAPSLTWSMAIQESKDLIWFTEQQSNSVWSFSMASETFTKHSLSSPNSFPFGLTLDKQGDVWFTEIGVSKIGEITNDGHLSEFAITPSGGGRIGNTGPAGIVVSNEGVVWFTEAYIASIASFSKGQFQQYNLTGRVTSPTGIAMDSSENLWMTEHGPSLIAEFNPSTDYFKSFSTTVPPVFGASLPYFIYIDSNGSIWFNEHYGNCISAFDPIHETLVEYEVPTKIAYAQNISGSITMTLAQDRVPWFTEMFSGKVGTLDISKKVPLYLTILNESAQPGGIVHIAHGGNVSLMLSISNTEPSPVTELHVSVGNLTGAVDNFQFNFTKPSEDLSSFNDALTILNKGIHPGVYFVTLSVMSQDISLSRLVEIDAA